MPFIARCAAVMLATIAAAPFAIAGLGFSDPASITRDPLTDEVPDSTPRLETSGTGVWIASWQSGALEVETDVYYSRSTDNGATWSKPTALNENPETDSIPDYSPRFATDGAGNWVCIWVAELGYSNNIVNTRIMVRTSSDDGETFTPPSILSHDADIYSEFTTLFAAGTPSPSLATDREGTWLAIWRASVPVSANGDIDLVFSRSTDNGETWSDAQQLSAPGDNVDEAPARIGVIGGGKWLVMRNYIGFLISKRLVVSRSNDGGQTWSAPRTLMSYAADDPVRHNIARIATNGAGDWVGVGDFAAHDLEGSLPLPLTDYDIFVIRSNDNGKTWTAPEPLNREAASDTFDDLFPGIETDLNGNWVAHWTSGRRTSGNADIVGAYSNSNGEMWTVTTALNTNAPIDAGNDAFSSLRTDGDGHWVLVWQSNNFPDHTNGEDTDIHYAVSTFTNGNGLFVLSPNGGERIKTGKNTFLYWLSIGEVGESVRVDLIRNGAATQSIDAMAVNDGMLKWQVPEDLEPGNGYKIKVESLSDPGVAGRSDNRFRIRARQ